MQAGSALKMVAGSLAMAGMLALSSPGVRVARAGDGDATPSEPSAVVSSSDASATCKAGDQNGARSTQSATVAKIAERIRAEMESSGEKPVVLNGRGYNYGVSRDPLRELQIMEAESAQEREKAPSVR